MLNTEKIYYSLRETEQETRVPVSTLRYWEKQFKELNPRKDGHGNRYYTREDQELIKRIKYIRDELKITRIEAIQKELKSNTKRSDERQAAVDILLRVKDELCEIRNFFVSDSHLRSRTYKYTHPDTHSCAKQSRLVYTNHNLPRCDKKYYTDRLSNGAPK